MNKLGQLFFSLVVLFLFYLLLFGNTEKEKGDLATLSLSSFEKLFQSETAREIFDLETCEAAEVFGDVGEEVFL